MVTFSFPVMSNFLPPLSLYIFLPAASSFYDSVVLERLLHHCVAVTLSFFVFCFFCLPPLYRFCILVPHFFALTPRIDDLYDLYDLYDLCDVVSARQGRYIPDLYDLNDLYDLVSARQGR